MWEKQGEWTSEWKSLSRVRLFATPMAIFLLKEENSNF